MRLCFLAPVVLLPTLAFANGGPVAWGGEGPRGGVQSVEHADVRLVSENLALTLLSDGRRYHAQARYVLASAAPRTVAFGVPVSIPSHDPMKEPGGRARKGPSPDVSAIARRVRIEIAGVVASCGIDASAVTEPPEPQPNQDPVAEDYLNSAWCVASLAVPAGDAIPLLLEYDGDLAFIDWSFTKSAFVEYGKRTLRWPLSPAGYWAGRPERVAIRLDPGPFDGLISATPPPTGTSRGVLAWDLPRPDLRSSPDFVVTVDAAPVLRHRELVASKTETQLDKGVTLSARASSTLAAQGKVSYAASNAVDRDAGTAWCAGKRGSGAGEWLAVRVEGRPPAAESCHLEGYVVVPGYAKSPRSWTGNNRLRSFRIGPCGGEGYATTVRLLDPGQDAGGEWEPLRFSDRPERAAVLVKRPLEDATCARLTVVDVVHGESDDTCISEFRPAFKCG